LSFPSHGDTENLQNAGIRFQTDMTLPQKILLFLVATNARSQTKKSLTQG